MSGFSVDFLVTALVTLFFVIDPLGVTPIFASLTAGRSFSARVAMALRGVIVAGIVLSVFAFFGQAVLEQIGISMAAFRAAGGVLLFLIGLEMIFERRTPRRSRFAEQSMAEAETAHGHDRDHGGEDISIVPLAIPLLAGPGALASVVLLMSHDDGALGAQAAVFLALAIVLVLSFLLLIFATVLLDIAGETVSVIVTRLMGMLLAALSIQYIFDGIKTYFGLG